MLRSRFIKSEFAKSTAILILGTIIAQSIPVLLQPLLRRTYSPEDFGAMAVYMTFFSIITIVSSLRYEAAIVLPKNDNTAANIFSLSVLINIGFCLGSLTFVLVFKNEIAQFVNLPEKYSGYLYLLPVSCLAFGIYQGMNYWLTRQKAFKASAYNKMVRRAAEGVVQSAAGFSKFSGGLFIGDLLGNIASVISGVWQIRKNGFHIKWISIKKIGYVFKKYIDFPKFNAIPTLLSNAATVLPFLFINKMYSTETVGYVDLSRLVLSIPLIFISATVSQVFFQQVTEKKNLQQSIGKDMMDILIVILTIIVVEVFLVLLWGPQLFGFVFGNGYAVSGMFSQILVFSFALNFIGSAFSSVFLTFDKIRINSIWQVAYFLAICSLLLFKRPDIFDFLKIYVGIEVAMHAIYCAMIYFTIREYEKKLKMKS